MRGSNWAYPVANLIHLAGLVLLVGNMLLLDLRLLGAGRRFALAAVSAVLTRLAIAGLLLLLASGALLFAADAVPLLGNRLMQLKLLLIALGTANALLFRALWARRLNGWDDRPPVFGRAQAAASLGCWLVAATLGRLIAYG
ncbi:MAG: hypothetical protein AB7G13_18565 [Lautropia sp.]